MTSWLVQNAIAVVPLAACTAIACRLLRSRPAVCHALWLLVLIKLLMPPLPGWRAPWLDQFMFRDAAVVEQPASGDQTPSALQIAKPGGPARARVTEVIVTLPANVPVTQNHSSSMAAADSRHDTSPAFQSDVPAGDNENPANKTTPVLAWVWPALFFLWTGGAMIALVWHLRRAAHLRRVLKSTTLASPSFRAEVALQCARLSLRVPQVRLSHRIACPLVMALPRPTLLWPASLQEAE
jgi:beta-lactamase regulating signal transducer with metallopeptidase domain